MTAAHAFDALHRAGWSIGDAKTGHVWFVSGTNGENIIKAAGATQTEAWRRAIEQARAYGMLRNAATGSGRF